MSARRSSRILKCHDVVYEHRYALASEYDYRGDDLATMEHRPIAYLGVCYSETCVPVPSPLQSLSLSDELAMSLSLDFLSVDDPDVGTRLLPKLDLACIAGDDTPGCSVLVDA